MIRLRYEKTYTPAHSTFHFNCTLSPDFLFHKSCYIIRFLLY